MGAGRRRDRGAPRTAARRQGWSRSLASLVLAIGVASAVVGLVLPLNQATQRVAVVDVALSSEHPPVVTGLPALPEGLLLTPAGDAVELRAQDVDRPTAALTELDHLVEGLLTLVGAVLLHRVLRDVAAGRPFAPGTSARIDGMAAVVGALAVVPPLTRSLATTVVLERADLGTDAGLGASTVLDVGLLLAAVLLLVVAQVFRHGGELTADVDGLV